jgi:transcription antitermination factor NusA-like protein
MPGRSGDVSIPSEGFLLLMKVTLLINPYIHLHVATDGSKSTSDDEVMAKLRIPLDVICVKTGILCPSCQRKVDEGLVQPYEVDIMRKLLELEEEVKQLKNLEYVKSYDLGSVLIVVLKGEQVDPEVIRKIRQALSKALDRKVRVVIKVPEAREVASQVLIPLTVKGVNVVWMPDGTEKYVVRVKGPIRKLPAPKEELEKVLSDILGAPIEIRHDGSKW